MQKETNESYRLKVKLAKEIAAYFKVGQNKLPRRLAYYAAKSLINKGHTIRYGQIETIY